MIGPIAAAMFAATSLKARFLAVSILLVAFAALIVLAVREPAGAH